MLSRTPSPLAGIAIALIVLLGCGRQPDDLHLTLRSSDASELQVGDDVRIGDLKVGEVESIDERSEKRFDVAIVVRGKYRERATETSEFTIKRDGFRSAHRHVTLESKEGPPLEDGAVIAAKQPLLDGIADWARETGERLQDSEARKRLQEFAEAVRSAAAKGREEWEAHKPLLEEQARALYEWAVEEAPRWADQIRDAVERLLKQVEEDLGSADV